MTDWPATLTTISATLKVRGFERLDRAGWYRGKLRFGHKSLSVSIHVPDRGFLEKPEIFIDDLNELPDGVKPHLEGPGKNRLCYAAPGTLRLDPYDPGPSILAVLDMAQQALEDSLKKRSMSAVAAEYTAYWNGEVFSLIDEPPLGDSRWSISQPNAALLLNRVLPRSGSSNVTASVVRIDAILHPLADCVVPETAKELSAWWEGNGLNSSLPFSRVKERLRIGQWIFAMGQNACLGVRLRARPKIKGSARDSILSKAALDATPLEYATAIEASAEFITRRCLGGASDISSPLAGKTIALIGCGTIGSFLASFLVRSGAGSGGGTLVLVDPEVLTPANLGRHTGGHADIARPKAEVVAEQLRQFHPRLAIEVYTKGVEHVWSRLGRCKLVIDATGVENVSEWINRQHLNEGSDRIVVYSWIVQEGAAVQTFVSRAGGDFACYRCLRPSLENSWRGSPLKDPIRATKFQYGTCGDGAYVPFSVATSAAAATLTLEAVTAVVTKGVQINLWTRIMDFKLAKSGSNRDQKIEKASDCPACVAR